MEKEASVCLVPLDSSVQSDKIGCFSQTPLETKQGVSCESESRENEVSSYISMKSACGTNSLTLVITMAKGLLGSKSRTANLFKG